MSDDIKNEREKEVREPKPFGVDYVPYKKRIVYTPGEFIPVAKTTDIALGKSKAFDFLNFKVAIFNIDGKYYAIKDACPHAQYPLAKGKLVGEVVACSSHNWQYNVRTGACVRAEHDMDITGMCVRTFELDIRGDEIWIKT